MVPYYQISGRGDVYSIVNEKGTWKGIFQARFRVKDDCMMLFSTKHGLQQFSFREDYFLLETKQQRIQRKIERRALHLILRKVTGDPYFTTKIMDLS
jgi:hypothetical protein